MLQGQEDAKSRKVMCIMKAIWIGDDDELGLRYGKKYEILSKEFSDTLFDVIDETGDDYLYPADEFEIIDPADVMKFTDDMTDEELKRCERNVIGELHEVNHLNYMNEDGKVFCRRQNRVFKLDAAVCSKCPYINGSLQGEGVECCWKDNVNDYLLSVHDPEIEQQRVAI